MNKPQPLCASLKRGGGGTAVEAVIEGYEAQPGVSPGDVRTAITRLPVVVSGLSARQ